MHYKDTSEITSIVDRFRDLSLPASEWTHEAHLTVALWFLRYHTVDEATCFLRSGIITYNKASGGENTPVRGYHETMTLFWIKAIHAYVLRNAQLDVLTLVNGFLKSPYAAKDHPFTFYTRDLILSTRARAFWIDPDLRSLEEQ